MLSFLTLSFLALSVSSVFALVVPRVPDASKRPASLEHEARYLAFGCHNKRADVSFFDQCCRPLQNGDEPSPVCWLPSNAPNSDSDDDSDLDDCDETEGSTNYDNHDNYYVPSSSTHKPEEKIGNVNIAVKTSTSNASSGLQTGGVATFYYQGGNAGACGKYHGDYDMIAAIDYRRYGNTSSRSSLCGKRVQITNTKNGKSVTVTIADACPTCKNGNSIDLSVGAFNRIATPEEGEVPIKWQFI